MCTVKKKKKRLWSRHRAGVVGVLKWFYVGHFSDIRRNKKIILIYIGSDNIISVYFSCK